MAQKIYKINPWIVKVLTPLGMLDEQDYHSIRVDEIVGFHVDECTTIYNKIVHINEKPLVITAELVVDDDEGDFIHPEKGTEEEIPELSFLSELPEDSKQWISVEKKGEIHLITWNIEEMQKLEKLESEDQCVISQFYIQKSPYFENEIIERLYQEPIKSFEYTGIVNEKLTNSDLMMKLTAEVALLADSANSFYHPESNNATRDIIHPSIYPYIQGISKLDESSLDTSQKLQKDIWGRKYEDSIYQWLPSEFKIDANGKCNIISYINNLDSQYEGQLTGLFEQLFEIALPEFEKIVSYANALEFPEEGEYHEYPDTSDALELMGDLTHISLRGRDLQVITKVVTYEDGIDGVWHVEGMSHENIIATGLFVLEQQGVEAEIQFKRIFTAEEAGSFYYRLPQRGSSEGLYVFDFLEKNLFPLGKIATQEGSMVFWPNSHIHKVKIEKTKEGGKRTIVVFWLVNPEVRIISTKHVPRQQGKITKKDAEVHLLKLMEERKYHKQNFNIREINLCEH